MTTRSAVVATIALTIGMMGCVAIAAMFAGEIAERTVGIVMTVLAGFAPVLTGLLLYLRLETVNNKADTAAVKADTAAAAAVVSAQKSAVIEQKVESVKYALMNGDMRENLKRAILELEDDPDVQARRIERIARGAAQGVQKDRHDLRSRRARERLRAQMEERGLPVPPRSDDES